MDLDPLHRALLVHERRHSPSDQVPHAFEQRVMARVRQAERDAAEGASGWVRGFWRAALSGVAVAAVLVGSLGVMTEWPGEAESGDLLSPVFLEEAVLASAQPEGEL